MRLDFSTVPLRNRAFSDKPMSFVDKQPKEFLSAIVDLVAIETGNRIARQFWQQRQFQNLVTYAAQRSAFWKKRIGTLKTKDMRLADLPPQTRNDVIKQLETEGSLTKPDETSRIIKHSTSGSTGKPVQFFLTQRNANYNSVRSVAQFFMEGRDLSLNRTRLRYNRASATTGFTTKKNDNWIGPLETIIRTGANKQIDYLRPNLGALCKELERDPIGYFVAQPRVYEMMLQHVEPEFFKCAGTAMIVPVAEALDPKLRAVFSSVCIPVRGSYSSEEVGLIGSECEKFGGHYHVATSNVIVEVIGEENIGSTGKPVGRILVTNLHSYATPFIRYDVGDVGTLEERCSCGHDGPVLSNVYGRTKALLQHADGRVTPFFPRGKELTAIARFDEYRIIQKTLTNIVVEIGGRESLSPEETAAFIALIKLHAGDEFDVQVKPVAEIDWGHSIKRLGFYCAI